MDIDLDEWRAWPWWPEGNEARVTAGFAGHEREIVVVIDPYTLGGENIPDLVVEAFKAQLPGSWFVEDRGTRIEVHPTGRFAGGFTDADVQTVAAALPALGLQVISVRVSG